MAWMYAMHGVMAWMCAMHGAFYHPENHPLCSCVESRQRQRKYEATHGWRNPPCIYEEQDHAEV